jgi:excisionase family DNA binding protein
MRPTRESQSAFPSNAEGAENTNQHAKFKITESENQAANSPGKPGKPRSRSHRPHSQQEDPSGNRVMTTGEVARYLKVSTRKVRELAELWQITEGAEGLRGFKIGKKLWRFLRKDLEAFCRRRLKPKRQR